MNAKLLQVFDVEVLPAEGDDQAAVYQITARDPITAAVCGFIIDGGTTLESDQPFSGLVSLAQMYAAATPSAESLGQAAQPGDDWHGRQFALSKTACVALGLKPGAVVTLSLDDAGRFVVKGRDRAENLVLALAGFVVPTSTPDASAFDQLASGVPAVASGFVGKVRPLPGGMLWQTCPVCRGLGVDDNTNDCTLCRTVRVVEVGVTAAQLERLHANQACGTCGHTFANHRGTCDGGSCLAAVDPSTGRPTVCDCKMWTPPGRELLDAASLADPSATVPADLAADDEPPADLLRRAATVAVDCVSGCTATATADGQPVRCAREHGHDHGHHWVYVEGTMPPPTATIEPTAASPVGDAARSETFETLPGGGRVGHGVPDSTRPAMQFRAVHETGATTTAWRAAVRSLFLKMHETGVERVLVTRTGTDCRVELQPPGEGVEGGAK